MDTAVTASMVDTVTPAARHGCIIRGTGWAFRTRDITLGRTLPVLEAAVTPVRGRRITQVAPHTREAAGRRKPIAVSRQALRGGTRGGTLAIRRRITPRAATRHLRPIMPAARRVVVDLLAMAGPRQLRTRVLRMRIPPRQNRLATHAAQVETRADIPEDTATPVAVVDTRRVAARTRSSAFH